MTSQGFDHRSVQHVSVKYEVGKVSMMHNDRLECIGLVISRLGKARLARLKKTGRI